MTRWVAGIVSALAVTVTGCGGNAPASATQAAGTPAATAPAPKPTAPVPSPSPVQTATPVDFEKLMAALPDAPAGWTRGKPKGELIGTGVPLSLAEADYDQGEATIHLEISDTSFNPLLLAPLSFMLAPTYSERTLGGYKKASPLGGSPGFETWDHDSNTAEVTVVVAGRIVINAKGRGVESVTPVRTLVVSIDQSKLKF